MKYIETYKIDIGKNFYNDIKVKQNDNSRCLKFHLYENGVPFSLQNRTAQLITKSKFNEFPISKDFEITGDNEILMCLDKEITINAGILDAEIVIYENSDIISSFVFKICIEKCVRDLNLKPNGNAKIKKLTFKNDSTTIIAQDSNGKEIEYKINKRNSNNKGSIENITTGKKIELEWEDEDV